MILHKNSVPIKLWESLIAKNSFLSPFQTPEFFTFFNSVAGITSQVLAIEESNELLALCVVTFQKEKGIKAYFSRRAIIYGGPLITSGKNGEYALTELLRAISHELKNKVIYLETRNFNDYSAYKNIFTSDGWSYEPYLNVQLVLQNNSIDDILGALKYNRRREIKLSLNEGAKFKTAENISEVESLYEILTGLYKRRVNRPLPSFEFFKELFHSKIGKIFVVLHHDKIIGGSYCFYYPNNSIYTMYYCSIRDYHPRIFPTHLAILAAIDFGIKNNLKFLDLMGAGKSGEEYGVRKYKSEFGGTLVEHGRFIKINNPFLYTLGKTALSLFKFGKK